jgi:DNA primase
VDFVEHMKSSVDIVRVVGEYVRLRKAGTRYVGLCPFHTEKTPSFGVHATHQYYKCFGCGAGGDVIKFVMEIEGLSFYEALKLLADRNGIPMPKRAEYSDPESKLRTRLHEMHELADRLFRSALRSENGAAARGYLEKRGVPDAIVEEFGLGYADRSGQFLVRRIGQEGFSREEMEASGLVSKRQDGSGYYDRFRGRLMFPIHSESGKIIAFAGRALEAGDEPKYLNSPETPIYRKSYVLYNLHRARVEIRKADHCILVEGYMDVIGLHAAGVREVVASCGTALTGQQVRLARRHSDKMLVNFDPDAAGASAAERSIQMLLEEGMHIRILALEEGLDPDEYVRRHGVEAYRAKMEKAESYFHWLADRARAKFDMKTAEGRVAGLKFLLPAIQRVSDKLERAAVASDVASYLGVGAGLVLEQFRKAAAHRSEQPVRPVEERVRADEKILINVLLARPDRRSRVLPRLKSLTIIEQLRSSRIFQTMFQLEEAGEDWDYAALQTRLEEKDSHLLASLVFADSISEQDVSIEQAEACVRTLENSEREARVSALRLQAKEAERAGNIEEALRLSEELNRIGKVRTPDGALL